MLTKRLTSFAVAAALCGGCGTLAGRVTEVESTTAQTTPVIFVGQPFDEAKNLLSGAGAEDITHAVGVIIYTPGEHRWFRLSDGKWLHVRAIDAEEPKKLVVGNLTLGDNDTNHIKNLGRKRYPEIARLELP